MKSIPKFLMAQGQHDMNSVTPKQQPVIPMSPAPVRKQRSESYAAAAQQFEELELTLDRTHTELVQSQNHIQLLEERIVALRADNAELVHERDYHKNRHTVIEISLRNAATMLLDLMRISPNEQPKAIAAETAQKDARIDEAAKGLEQDLNGGSTAA